jgi:putative membrane protein insertion efficiency factor
MNPASLLLTLLIRAYQWILAPLLPANRCRFEPSCSHYGLAAIKGHGPIIGLWLTLRRLLRCHPWGGSGYDPVPPAKNSAPIFGRQTPRL